MELYQSLRERIESNVFPVGAKLPTEKELSAEFNISRQTVRQAFDLLRQDGLIRSVQGSGSYVNFASLHRQKTGQIAVICTYISEYIFPSILRGIENVTKENGTPQPTALPLSEPFSPICWATLPTESL